MPLSLQTSCSAKNHLAQPSSPHGQPHERSIHFARKNPGKITAATGEIPETMQPPRPIRPREQEKDRRKTTGDLWKSNPTIHQATKPQKGRKLPLRTKLANESAMKPKTSKTSGDSLEPPSSSIESVHVPFQCWDPDWENEKGEPAFGVSPFSGIH